MTRRYNAKPFSATPPPPPPRDPRVPGNIWELPERIERANALGPRYNQLELARASGLVQSVISKLKNKGNLYGLRLETIYKLAAALNVSVCWLLGESKSGGPKRRRSEPKPKGTKKRTEEPRQ